MTEPFARPPKLAQISGVLTTLLLVVAPAAWCQQPSPSTMESKLMLDVLALTRRVEALEKGAHRVTAPFEVVDPQGNPIMKVDVGPLDRAVVIYDANKHGKVVISGPRASVEVYGSGSSPVGTFGTDEEGNPGIRLETKGEMTIINSEEVLLSKDGLHLSAKAHSLTMGDTTSKGDTASKPQAELGRGAKGNMTFKIRNSQGEQVVGLGDNPALGDGGALQISDVNGKAVAAIAAIRAGWGAVSVYNSSGKSVAEIGYSADGRVEVAVRDAAGNAVAFLTPSENGGGNLTLTDPKGEGVFSAGWAGEEGAACVNVKSGEWCMGKNLPLEMR